MVTCGSIVSAALALIGTNFGFRKCTNYGLVPTDRGQQPISLCRFQNHSLSRLTRGTLPTKPPENWWSTPPWLGLGAGRTPEPARVARQEGQFHGAAAVCAAPVRGGVSGKRLRVLKMERFIHFQGYGVT